MSCLPSLIRLRRMALDHARRELSALRGRSAALAAALARVEDELSREAETARADVELLPSFAGYRAAMSARRRRLADEARDVAALLVAAERSASDGFADLKQLEIALAAQLSRIARDATRRDQAQADAFAIDLHRRRAAITIAPA